MTLEKTNGKPVMVIGATNHPDSLDQALRRKSHFFVCATCALPFCFFFHRGLTELFQVLEGSIEKFALVCQTNLQERRS